MIAIREIERPDLPYITAWRNDRELVSHLGNHFFFIGPEVDARWFDAYLAGREANVRLAIVRLDQPRRPIGCAFLTGVHRVNRHAEFAIFIGDPEERAKGHGERATRLVLDHAFYDLNLHRVHLTVLASNVRALALYRRVGFREEGVLREAVYKAGAYHDLVTMAILRPEYEAGDPTHATFVSLHRA